MRRLCVLGVLILAACGKEAVEEPATLVTYNIDASRISVSGLSSGAHMAAQLHMAHSEIFNGLAMVGGGPYYCSRGELSRGIGECLSSGEIDVDALRAYAQAKAAEDQIDAVEDLADDPVWIFHGALDDVVGKGPSDAAAALYASLVAPDAVTYVTDIEVAHGMPTLDTGLPCEKFGTPFLNACGYDGAGEILKTMYGVLNPRVVATGELRSIPQPGADDAEMLEDAFVYVPASCAAGEACGVHVAIHGCSQSAEYIGDAFAAGAGFNEWAESNHLLVLYPQVASSRIAPMNPYGCWDWWGYTNENYATRAGLQIEVIMSMLDALAGKML